MSELDHYAVLEVAPEASGVEIKAAFRLRAKACHPDKNEAVDAAEAFRQFNRSYEILRDPEKRRHFDWLRSQKRTPPTPKRRSASARQSHHDGPVRKSPSASPSPPAAGSGETMRREGQRRRAHRGNVARHTDVRGERNIDHNADWLESLTPESIAPGRRAGWVRAATWIIAVALGIVLLSVVLSR